MNVAGILRDKGHDVFTVDPRITLAEAARLLDERRVGAMVIVDRAESPVGVISERDIIRAVARGGPEALQQPVSAFMSGDVVTASTDDSIDELMVRMTGRRIRHLPVVENGRLTGIVSIGDVVKRKIEDAEAEAEAMKAYIASA
ncbi:MAG: CBS domain-containing protein [Maricaulaceae bacterium]|nr:CBS domain-containing protein [Maricaulaceae bacterium]